MLGYICKYTPIELFAGFGTECKLIEDMPENFDISDTVVHANVCGFVKSLIQHVLKGGTDELVLVNCCDCVRRAYDVIKAQGNCKFLYFLDLPHKHDACSVDIFANNIIKMKNAYEEYSGKQFDMQKFLNAFQYTKPETGSYIGLLGTRAGQETQAFIRQIMPLPLRNLACTGNRRVIMPEGNFPADKAGILSGQEANAAESHLADTQGMSFGLKTDAKEGMFAEIMKQYAQSLLSMTPCMRMGQPEDRRQLYLDPNLKGIIYHTIKFCDYYGLEYAELKDKLDIPILKIETDYSRQSTGQLKTRIEAFVETLAAESGKYNVYSDCSATPGAETGTRPDEAACNHTEIMTSGGIAGDDGKLTERTMPGDAGNDYDKHIEKTISGDNIKMDAFAQKNRKTGYYAGIDSGSTSTDAVIMDDAGNIAARIILPTGGGAQISAEKALDEALRLAGLKSGDILSIVKTGYGREFIATGKESMTEISCHAKGAHFLCPSARTVIDIGGQDSKIIKIDEKGAVLNFVMNDKCAAGTGRFMEMMAQALGLTLEEISTMGLDWKEDITISSMCTVFAESEVVSLVAQNKNINDIVHGLDKSVASKIASLMSRIKPEADYIITGGVAQNKSVVSAIEEKLGIELFVCEDAQLCGAIGAAIFAREHFAKKG